LPQEHFFFTGGRSRRIQIHSRVSDLYPSARGRVL
jgi:hypothetical protein